MNRRRLIARLFAASIALSLTACNSTEYGAPRYTIEVASDPVGAVLYVLEERAFDRLAGELASMDLEAHRIGRTTPAVPLTTSVRAYGLVLVGDWDGRRSMVRFTPSHDGEKFTVTAP